MDIDKFKSELEGLRARIDAVDSQILQLLEQRTGIVHEVGKLKKSYGIRGSYIHPKREADMMRVLLDRFKGTDYPSEAVEVLWRTLIGVATSIESPLALSVFQPFGYPHTHYLAREYFGKHLRERTVENFTEVLADLKQSPHFIGIVPSPEFALFEGKPWWLMLAESGVPARVFACLPFVQRQKKDAEMSCLAIGDVPLESTGKDVTLIVARFQGETAEPIETICHRAVLDCSLPSATVIPDRNNLAALIMADGFLSEDAAVLDVLRFKLGQHSSNLIGTVNIIGAFAIPYFIPDETMHS